jgi:hypothetical protein
MVYAVINYGFCSLLIFSPTILRVLLINNWGLALGMDSEVAGDQNRMRLDSAAGGAGDRDSTIYG